ncbi:VOC family protein [Pedobacter gandavensis]|uniref:VOC family protein n=1 Tax=Pedobacter gandavensis TaxID=2679963 RepID=UPI00292CD27D|nr:VOC family protein [Pedobacter gandavensis]
MNFNEMIETKQIIIKLSVSNVLEAQAFYVEKLGFSVVEEYTINSGGDYGMDSYVQLNHNGLQGFVALGLFKDIDDPMKPEDAGTVPSFVVKDIDLARDFLITQGVDVGGVIENTSDLGYVDRFAFFNDPDNNSLVIRQNMN